MARDCLGNAVSLDDPSALAGIDDFVEGFIASEARAAQVLAWAERDASPLLQAYAATVHMFAESRDAPANARPFMARAQAGAARATTREQRYIAALRAWVDGDTDRALALLEEQVQLHPRDLASLKLAQYHAFNRGDSPRMLRLALSALPQAGDVPYLHGMLAFGWEQCHALREAEACARHAIALRRKEPWAHHALAHVMLTQGRLHEGHAFLSEVSDTWTGLNSFMVTHNWWHQALFALELDRPDEVLALYDQRIWGVAKDYTQDQANAISLLSRLELAGVTVGQERWRELAQWLAGRTADQVLPFLDLHYVYGLSRAQRPEAAVLMDRIETHAAAHGGVWRDVALPAARGLLAHAQGDPATAASALGQALPRMLEIGGSHAQRDWFEQIHLDALLRAGRLTGAQNLLQQRCLSAPESVRLRRQAHALYHRLGLAGVADRLLP
ncbi:tetratricopeptide repeat protein [Ramlibacter sp. AN1015]|uniref:tetratricopeptide repeat protein n=1 Tax=Ramlibacter sp. AN1015 TaxID=3133428 RepID=UPI0030BBB946